MVLSLLDGIGLIEQVFLWLNKGVYWLAEKAYALFMDIANVQLFSPDSITSFGQRIYVLLGIIMLFKLTFSFITYIVNPDSFSDKQKGAGKLIINVVVVLVLLVTTPFIFEGAMKIQRLVLQGNVIPNLFLGMGSQTGQTIDYGNEGEEISFLVFASFFQPNPAIFGEPTTSDEEETDEEETDEEETDEEETTTDTSFCRNNLFAGGDATTDTEITGYVDIGNVNLKMHDDCAAVLNAATGTAFDGQISEAYALAYQTSNMNILTDTDLIKATSEVDGQKVDTFNFHGIIAFVAGIFLAWILLMFCFDIAIRTIKLVFLQLIAPIPIVAYADPKSNGIFKKWLRQCLTTYFDLFIRLIAIFFAVFIIQQVSNARIVTGIFEQETSLIHNSLIFIFIIFGALLFAQQLPKLISDITGAKFDGGFTLNPMKKIGQSPFATAAVGGVGAALGAGAANTWNAARTNIAARRKFNEKLKKAAAEHGSDSDEVKGMIANRKKHLQSYGYRNAGRFVGTAIGGIGSGATRGVWQGLHHKDGSATKAIKNAQQNVMNARTERQEINKMNADLDLMGKGEYKYDFFQRNVMDPIDRAADFKNKDGGEGKYAKEVKDIQIKLGQLEKQLQAAYINSTDPTALEEEIKKLNEQMGVWNTLQSTRDAKKNK